MTDPPNESMIMSHDCHDNHDEENTDNVDNDKSVTNYDDDDSMRLMQPNADD